MGEPFQVMAAGCGGYRQRDGLAPTSCSGEPTVVGLLVVGQAGRRRSVWRGFACDAHAHQLVAARPLLARDRDVLARRRDRHRVEIAGRRWAGEREGALARGREADVLVERAVRWAVAHVRPDR